MTSDAEEGPDVWEAAGAERPVRWTPEHVGQRLVEAFRTLDKLPRPQGPRAAGNHWPRHRVEFADFVSQAELPEAERREREDRRNAYLCRPDGREIAQMDRVLEWVRSFRMIDPELTLLVTLWALRVARRRSLRGLCRERGWTPPTFYKRRDRALAAIVEMLETRRENIF